MPSLPPMIPQGLQGRNENPLARTGTGSPRDDKGRSLAPHSPLTSGTRHV